MIMSLFIQKSKTDRYREGSSILIACTDGVTCPVRMTRRYLELSKMTDQSDQYLFSPTTFCKTSNTYVLKRQKSLSYTRAREILLDALQSMGLVMSKFGLHSLRAGGATAAANQGVCDRLFKKHGRWKSDSAKDGYVAENIKRQLLDTKNLGI